MSADDKRERIATPEEWAALVAAAPPLAAIALANGAAYTGHDGIRLLCPFVVAEPVLIHIEATLAAE